jgi:hypothetical protein
VEQPALTPRRLLAAAAAVVLLVSIVGAALVAVHRRGADHSVRPLVRSAPDARAPTGTRIRVEVLNASKVSGLARRATFDLRDRGFDVVEAGNASQRRDTTLILSRSGHDDWAQLVARAMGGAPVEARPDSSHYVDVTVLVGALWRPPPEPFYP